VSALKLGTPSNSQWIYMLKDVEDILSNAVLSFTHFT
jgi:hypothetical protein